MRAEVQPWRQELRAARVDKPRKEEAAGVWDQVMEKERRRAKLTLPRAHDGQCSVLLLQSFFAAFVAG